VALLEFCIKVTKEVLTMGINICSSNINKRNLLEEFFVWAFVFFDFRFQKSKIFQALVSLEKDLEKIACSDG
jgi:hypothetical protein